MLCKFVCRLIPLNLGRLVCREAKYGQCGHRAVCQSEGGSRQVAGTFCSADGNYAVLKLNVGQLYTTLSLKTFCLFSRVVTLPRMVELVLLLAPGMTRRIW